MWQPIETAPKDGTPVTLVNFSPSGFLNEFGAGEWVDGEWHNIGLTCVAKPTHWLPLPEMLLTT